MSHQSTKFFPGPVDSCEYDARYDTHARPGGFEQSHRRTGASFPFDSDRTQDEIADPVDMDWQPERAACLDCDVMDWQPERAACLDCDVMDWQPERAACLDCDVMDVDENKSLPIQTSLPTDNDRTEDEIADFDARGRQYEQPPALESDIIGLVEEFRLLNIRDDENRQETIVDTRGESYVNLPRNEGRSQQTSYTATTQYIYNFFCGCQQGNHFHQAPDGSFIPCVNGNIPPWMSKGISFYVGFVDAIVTLLIQYVPREPS